MIARKSLFIVIAQFLTRFLGWIGLVILAKFWGDFAPDALGVIGFAMAFIGLFNVIGDLGFNQAHIKRISEGKDLGTCIGTFAAIKIILTLAMTIIVFIALYIQINVLEKGFTDATTMSVIFVFLLYYILLNIQSIPSYTFNGKSEIAKMQITGLFENILKVPLTILVVLAGVSLVNLNPSVQWPQFLQPLQQFLAEHTLGALAMTYVFGAAATVIVGFWFLRKYPVKKPNWEFFKSYLYFALPIILISVISVISTNIDKIMIGFFWTSKEVGYYFTVQQITGLVGVFSSALSVILFPTISNYHSKKNFENIKHTTYLANRYISMVITPVVSVCIVFVVPVINILLSESFLPAKYVLITILIYVFITTLMAPYGSLISGMNRPGIAAIIGAIMCIINIALNLLFIPQWGLLSPIGINGPEGAAAATLISSIVGIILLMLVAKKLAGIKLLHLHTPRHIIAGIIMGLILYSITYQTSLLSIIRWYTFLGLSFFGIAIYLFILFIIKEFKKQDLIFFLDLLKPKKMLRYISSELKDKPKSPN